jgi:hypothetical protein
MNLQKPPKRSWLRSIKKTLAAPFVFVAAVIIILEDWLWDDLARFAAFVGQLPILRSIESLIVALPPYFALFVFAVPSLLLIPVKLFALYFIANGQKTLGFLTVVAAKLVGTALIARLFTLTRPKLMRIGWFAWLYERFISFKGRLYRILRSTKIYQIAREQHLRIKAGLRLWLLSRRASWLRRWYAARRLSRRGNQNLI